MASATRAETAVPTIEVPAFDLRKRRDLMSRRLWREAVRRSLRVALLLGIDALSVTAALTLAIGAVARWSGAAGNAWHGQLPIFLALTISAQAAVGSYGSGRSRRSTERTGVAIGLATFSAWLVGETSPLGALEVSSYLIFAGTVLALIVLGRWVFEFALRAAYAAGIGRKNTLIIGSGDDAVEAFEHFRKAEERDIRIVGHLSPTPQSTPLALGGLDRLGAVIEEQDVRNVIVTASLSIEEFRSVVSDCFQHGTAVGVVPGMLTEFNYRMSGRDVAGWPLVEFRVPRLLLLQLVLKRAVDIVMSLVGILALLPVFLVLAIAVKLDSPGPILFRQKRLGVGGRPFTINKFRSMRSDAEAVLRSNRELYQRYVANNYKLPEGEDPRISRVGRFLRKTSLDELPQLFNVLQGDMSLVGPRPIVPQELEEYGDRAPLFLAVKPGLTGYWQISGRSGVGYPERAELDIYYVVRWSLMLDFKILLLTIPRVLRGSGAH